MYLCMCLICGIRNLLNKWFINNKAQLFMDLSPLSYFIRVSNRISIVIPTLLPSFDYTFLLGIILILFVGITYLIAYYLFDILSCISFALLVYCIS